MAKKDVLKYYTKTLDQYKRMSESAQEMQRLYDAGEVDEERLKNYMPLIEGMRENLETISYIVFLLTVPRFKFQALKFKKSHPELYNYFLKNKKDKDSVSASNEAVLQRMQEFLKEFEKEEENGTIHK